MSRDVREPREYRVKVARYLDGLDGNFTLVCTPATLGNSAAVNTAIVVDTLVT